MKKILIVAILGLFALTTFATESNVSNKKITKIVKVIIDKKVQWQVRYHCPGMQDIVVCCWSTYSGAHDYMMNHDIPCSEHAPLP